MNRILLISNFLSQWGSRSVCEELASRLSAAGMHVVTASDKRGRFARLIDMLQTVWRRREEYDVAHVAVFSGAAFIWAEATCRMLRSLGKPYALTLHGGNLPAFARLHPDRVRKLFESAQIVVSPSMYLRDAMTIYRPDIGLMENALDVGRYPFRLRNRTEPALVWLRSFHEVYNPTLAPAVLAKVSARFPRARMFMVGPDKEDGSLQRTKLVAVQQQVVDRITFVGGVDKAAVPEWLDRGDVFLNTSNIDNTPVSVIEALACGLCVVSTNVGGIPYLLEHETNALLVPPSDLDAMSGAVLRILTDARLARVLSENARHKAEFYDWSVILPKWTQMICRAVDSSRGLRRAA